MADIKLRTQQASYLNVSSTSTEDYAFMGSGFTGLNENPGAQTTEKRYINQASATTVTSSYKPQHAFDADLIESEEAIAFIDAIAKERKTGGAAETDYVIVDLDKSTGANVYEARHERVAVEVSSYGDDGGMFTLTGNLNSVSDTVPGTFNTSSKTFTPTVIAG